MTYEAELELHQLTDSERDLREAVFQLASVRYSDAVAEHTPSVPYLQGFAGAETGEPTDAFRLDSAASRLNRKGEITREKIFVFVPKGSDPDLFLTRFWVKRIDFEGNESMLEVDENGARTHQRLSEIEELAKMNEDLTPVDLFSFSPEDIVASAVKEKRSSVRNLGLLKEMFIDPPAVFSGPQYKLVPFAHKD